jgi:hypothetical protein
MTDDAPPPFVYDGLDPAIEAKSVIGEVADAVKGTAQRRFKYAISSTSQHVSRSPNEFRRLLADGHRYGRFPA